MGTFFCFFYWTPIREEELHERLPPPSIFFFFSSPLPYLPLSLPDFKLPRPFSESFFRFAPLPLKQVRRGLTILVFNFPFFPFSWKSLLPSDGRIRRELAYHSLPSKTWPRYSIDRSFNFPPFSCDINTPPSPHR